MTVYQKQLSATAQAYAMNNLGQMLEKQKIEGYAQYINDLKNVDSKEFNDPTYGIVLDKGTVKIDAAHVNDPAAWNRLGQLFDKYLIDKDWYVPFDATIRKKLIEELERALTTEKREALTTRLNKCKDADNVQSFTDYVKANFPDYLPPVFESLGRPGKVLGHFGVNPASDYVVFGMKDSQLVVRAIERVGTGENAFVGGMGQSLDTVLNENLEEYYSGNLFIKGSVTEGLLNQALDSETVGNDLKKDILQWISEVKLTEEEAKALASIKKAFEKTEVTAASQLRALVESLSATKHVPLQQLSAHILVESYKKYLPQQFTAAKEIFLRGVIRTKAFPNTGDNRNTDDAYMTTKMEIVYVDDMTKNDKELQEKAGLVRQANDDAAKAKTMPFGKFIKNAFTNHGPMGVEAYRLLLNNDKLPPEAQAKGRQAFEALLEENPVLKFVAELETGTRRLFADNIKGDTQYAQLRNAIAYLHEKGESSYNGLDGFKRITQALQFVNDTLFGKVNRKEALSQETIDRLNGNINLIANVSHYVYRREAGRSVAVNANSSVGSMSANAAPVVGGQSLTLTVTTATPDGNKTSTLTTANK